MDIIGTAVGLPGCGEIGASYLPPRFFVAARSELPSPASAIGLRDPDTDAVVSRDSEAGVAQRVA